MPMEHLSHVSQVSQKKGASALNACCRSLRSHRLRHLLRQQKPQISAGFRHPHLLQSQVSQLSQIGRRGLCRSTIAMHPAAS